MRGQDDRILAKILFVLNIDLDSILVHKHAQKSNNSNNTNIKLSWPKKLGQLFWIRILFSYATQWAR